MSPQRFGGPWTEQKLAALEHYLKAYLRIFTANPKAAGFTRHYVDAFAGSGLRQSQASPAERRMLAFEGSDADQALDYMDGSVRKVLSLDENFHRYWFVEKDRAHAAGLRHMLSTEFPGRERRCTVHEGDANGFLRAWSTRLGPMDRAVVFLDPYGMEVEWSTIEQLARTEKVDLWMLFPASGVLRMLPHRGPPDEAWSRRLTMLFGDESWLDEFYSTTEKSDLFGQHQVTERRVTEHAVAEYLIRRMKRIFVGVVDAPLVLRNSRKSPLFMLVFAASNRQGAKPALKIANYLIQSA